MATPRQKTAARKNVRKAQATWKDMTPRQRALAQPQGRQRKKPGTTGKGKFYRIEVRPKGEFTSYRIQDVGKKGGLERLAGRRPSGSWATVSWLIAKKNAHVSAKGELVLDNAKERSAIKKAVRGPIRHLKGDIFVAHPAKNVPERAKPTRAMKTARAKNIKKAQAANRKKR